MVNATDDFFGSSDEPSNLVELLQWRALQQPDLRLYTFLTDGETEETHLTCGELDRQARAIGAWLQDVGATGERALLLYPPGLDYIAGFFGCLYAGVIAVPAYPPDPARLNRTLPRLQAAAADAQATVALTTASILSMAKPVWEFAPDLGTLQWMTTDTVADGLEDEWQEPAVSHDSLAFLQYTSGSTRTPRGVMLTHHNLLYNSALISQAFELTPDDIGVVWLPPYHDMGLIGGILQPVYRGFHCVLMSPLAFLRRPVRWLQAVSRHKATISGGPNFAYDLCVRKITPEERATLDLSNWGLAFNGAEPVRRETLERFAATFESCGFRREAFYPCYGLAEATLVVTGGLKAAPPVIDTFHGAELERNRVVAASAEGEDVRALVGCGQNMSGQEIIIADPESLTQCPPDQVGEIWVSGPSVAQGYWNRSEETGQIFRAHLADTGDGPFLRTGDLGFLREGELFITGRLKDLIIIRGRNHYPQDIELTVEQSHPALRRGCGAAFSVDVDGEERLAVVQEVYTHKQPDTVEVIRAIRQAVTEAHEAQAYAVVLIEPRSIPKTSSGKIQRHACRAAFLAGTLDVVEAGILEEAEPLEKEVPAARQTLLTKALLSMEQENRQSLLESHIRERMAQALRLAPSQLDPKQPLSTLGLDSVTTIDVANEIESDLGVTLPMESLLQSVNISQLASQVLAELTAPASARLAAYSPTQEAITEHPLSRGQRALWFLQNLASDSAAYNLVQAVRIRGELEIPAFQRAFQKLVDRHRALRTTFAVRDGEPIQRIHEHMDVYFEVEDASTWGTARLNDRLAEEVYRPFDLERGPLMRVFLFTRSAQERILLLAMHHIVTDLWSLAVLMYELGVLYPAERAGTPAQLRVPRAQYTDYIRWQEEMLAGPEGKRLWSYWQEQLAGELPVLNLPTDRPRPPIQTHRGASQSLRIGTGLTQRLKSLSEASGVALHMTLLAAFQVLLHRYTGQEDILMGYPKAGRSPKVARLVGYFVNPVALRADLSGDPTYSAFLKQVRQTVLGAFEHDAYPFPLLVERLQPARDLSRSPLFQVMFAWQKTTRLVNNQLLTSFALNEAGGKIDVGGIALESMNLDQRVVPFDLSLLMAEADGELATLMEYNTDLFEGATITRMLGHFQTLLEGIVANPERPVSTLPLSTEAERRQLLTEWNHTEVAPKQYQSIPQLFEARVADSPDAIAVVLGTEQLTYKELNRRANQLAHHLRKLGVGPEVIVGLLVERSVEGIVGLLGILKAGGADLPLDPSNPEDRLAFMLEDARVAVLLTQAHLVDRYHASRIMHHTSRRVVCLDADWETITQESVASSGKGSDENPISEATAENLAYVIYTSGSTGRPKGVLISNGVIANHCQDIREHFELGASDRVLQFASYVFDQSMEQVLATLTTGATLVLRGPEVWPTTDFSRVVSDYGLTVVNLPPAYWHQWVQDWIKGSERIPNDQLRLVISGGDIMPSASLRLWQETPMRSARLLNAYGPTETTITAMTFDIPPQLDGYRIPIGRPPANRTMYILDERGDPVPIGVPGELYLGGAGLARGYLNRPDLTAEKFIPDPFSQRGEERRGGRLYRTGDLARYLPDGNVEFLGRVDHQVKIRGFRIELSGIEAMLSQHPHVREVAVVVREDTVGDPSASPTTDRRLVAYLVPDQKHTPTTSELRGFLREKLPAYMVPSTFVLLDVLPVTSSGKVDRGALPTPDKGRPDLACAYVAPDTPVEEELARMWAEELGVERVGRHDNFFELGGHSLLATKLVSRVRNTFQVELPLRDLFDTPTVAGLAVTIARRLAEQEEDEEIAQLLAEVEQLSEESVQEMLTGGIGV